MQPWKKVKENTEPTVQIPKNVIVNFINNRNEALGVYEVPVDAGPKEFQELVNSILPETDREEFKVKLEVFFQQIQYTNFEANL